MNTSASAKRLIATWRILVGVWAPKRMELPLAALAQYTTPVLPKENPWVDRPKKDASPGLQSPDTPKVLPSDTPDLSIPEPPVKSRKKRPQTRRIMRHVLRARVEAVKALASLFDQIERSGSGKKVKASQHLARQYGWEEDGEGWRTAAEVVRYLRARGAKIPTIQSSSAMDDNWAAASSDGEGNTTFDESSSTQEY